MAKRLKKYGPMGGSPGLATSGVNMSFKSKSKSKKKAAVKLPDGSGVMVGTVGKKKKVKKMTPGPFGGGGLSMCKAHGKAECKECGYMDKTKIKPGYMLKKLPAALKPSKQRKQRIKEFLARPTKSSTAELPKPKGNFKLLPKPKSELKKEVPASPNVGVAMKSKIFKARTPAQARKKFNSALIAGGHINDESDTAHMSLPELCDLHGKHFKQQVGSATRTGGPKGSGTETKRYRFYKSNLKKSFNDLWIIRVGDEFQKMADAHQLPFERHHDLKGTEHTWIFKCGECEVRFSTMGKDSKIKMHAPEKSDELRHKFAKTMYYRLMIEHETPLQKAKHKRTARGPVNIRGREYSSQWQEGLGEQRLRQQKRLFGRKRRPQTGSKKPKSTAQRRLSRQQLRLFGEGEHVGKAKIERPKTGLERHAEHARNMSDAELHGARKDVRDTLKIWDKHYDNPKHKPYVDKLYDQRDAYAAEHQRRFKNIKKAKPQKLQTGEHERATEEANVNERKGIKGVHRERGSYGNPYGAPNPIKYGVKQHARVMREMKQIKPKLTKSGRVFVNMLEKAYREKELGKPEEQNKQQKPKRRKTKKKLRLHPGVYKAFGLAPQRSKLASPARRGNVNISAHAGRPKINVAPKPSPTSTKAPKITTKSAAITPVKPTPEKPSIDTKKSDLFRFSKKKKLKRKVKKDAVTFSPAFNNSTGQSRF